MSETLRTDINRLWIACKTMKRHLAKADKNQNEKKLLEQDLKNLIEDVSRLNLIMHHDEFTPKKIGDAAIVERFKQEGDFVATVRMAIGPLASRRDLITNAVYNHDERAIQEITQKLDNLINVLDRLRTFNEEIMKLIEQKESELHHLLKLVS